MPITMAHPVVAIPFKKLGLPLSALIIGSLLPDFEFFIRLSDQRFIGHTIPGIFIFCLPVGLLSLFLYHNVIKIPLLSLLPHNHQKKLLPFARPFSFFPIARFIKIIVALVIGIVSHLFIDACTHSDSPLAGVFPFLDATIFSFSFAKFKLYFLLQHLLSISGMLIMTVWYFRWFFSTEHTNRISHHTFSRNQKIKIISFLLVFTLTVSLAIAGISTFSKTNISGMLLLKHFLCQSTITSISSFLAVTFLYGIVWHSVISKRKPSPKSETTPLL